MSQCSQWILGLVLGAALVPIKSGLAYNLSPYFSGPDVVYAKWGDPHGGTPSGEITWSWMPTGTSLSPSLPSDVLSSVHGTSDLAGVFAQVGGEAAALELIEEAMAGWAAVADLEFVYVGVDDGTPFGAPIADGQKVGDIRIGGFEIDGFSAARGYVPFPPSGSTQGGDILFNTRSDISVYDAPEREGELYDLYPPQGGFYRNEFQGLFAHELGHALGLLHSDVSSGLMCGYVDDNFDGLACAYNDPDEDGRAPVNRLPDADDIAGIEFLYGRAPEREPDGDFNADGRVDGDDFLVWQRGRGGASASHALGDANGDAVVNADDLAVWEAQFAVDRIDGTATTQRVPEPNMMGLVSLVLLRWVGCRRMSGWARPSARHRRRVALGHRCLGGAFGLVRPICAAKRAADRTADRAADRDLFERPMERALLGLS